MFAESYSESPRQPSPWDTPCHPLWTVTTVADVGTTSSDSFDGCGDIALRALIPEDDLHGHIEYKLRLPALPSVDRMARLTSQLKWRLLEGGGVIDGVIRCGDVVADALSCLQEAIYELGVCDNGLLLGISHSEMSASLKTLQAMAANLGALVRITREEIITGHVVPDSAVQQPFAQAVTSCSREPRIPHAATGAPLASTTVATLTSDSLTPSSSKYASRASSRWSYTDQSSFFPEIMASFLSTERAALAVTAASASSDKLSSKTSKNNATQRITKRQRKALKREQDLADSRHRAGGSVDVAASEETVQDGIEQRQHESESDDDDCVFPDSFDDFAGDLSSPDQRPSNTALSIPDVATHALPIFPSRIVDAAAKAIPDRKFTGAPKQTASDIAPTGDPQTLADEEMRLAVRRLARKQWKKDKKERDRRAAFIATNARTAFLFGNGPAAMCPRCTARARHERNVADGRGRNATLLLPRTDLNGTSAGDDAVCECSSASTPPIIDDPNDKHLDGVAFLFSLAAIDFHSDSGARTSRVPTAQSGIDADIQAESARLRDILATREAEREAERLRKITKRRRKEHFRTLQKQRQPAATTRQSAAIVNPVPYKIPNIDGKKHYIATRQAEDARGRYAVECAVFYPAFGADYAEFLGDGDDDPEEELEDGQQEGNVRGGSGISMSFSSASSKASNGSDSMSSTSLDTPTNPSSFSAASKNHTASTRTSGLPSQYIDWSSVMSEIEREAQLGNSGNSVIRASSL